jgi:hypothetical protein
LITAALRVCAGNRVFRRRSPPPPEKLASELEDCSIATVSWARDGEARASASLLDHSVAQARTVIETRVRASS